MNSIDETEELNKRYVELLSKYEDGVFLLSEIFNKVGIIRSEIEELEKILLENGIEIKEIEHTDSSKS